MITSAQNPLIKWVRLLLSQKHERLTSKAFVIEGVRLIEEAVNASWYPDLLLFTDALPPRGKALVEKCIASNCRTEEVPTLLMNRITGTENPQGILAVLSLRPVILPSDPDFVVIVDGVSDPGNLGTLLRTSAAAGVQAAFLTQGSADPYSPKVLRSGMGAHMRLPIITLPLEDIYAKLSVFSRPLNIFLSEPDSATACWDADLRSPLALVIGSEAEGISMEFRTKAHATLRIPMPGNFESLNAAVAAGILIFEVVRQRKL